MAEAGPQTTLPAVTAATPEYGNFSTTNSTSSDWNVPDKSLQILLPVVYSMICCIGLTGNTIVIHVVTRMSSARTVANSYILNLAIADELLLLSTPFICVGYVTWDWPFGPVMCKLVYFADSINQFASVFCLTAMSIDRYQAVVHPMTSRGYRTIRRAVVINVTIWIVALVVVSPVLAFVGLHESEGHVYCNVYWPKPVEAWRVAFIAYSGLLGFAMPLTIITACAVFMFQNRVAMFIAAHFGHSSLAKQLIRTGTRPDDPVGEHPARQWCHTLSHVERLKTPVHEAAEFGQLTVLRVFLFYDFSCVTQPDGHGLLPLSYSLRNKHKECALFLLNKISVILNCHGSGMVCSMNIYRKMRRWANRARTRVCLLNGIGGALYQRNQDVFKERGLVGQGVIVDGFGRSERSAVPRSKMPRTPADTFRIGMTNVKNILVITPTNGKRPRQEGGRWKRTATSRAGPGASKDLGLSVTPHKERSSLHLPSMKSGKWSASVRGSFSSQKSVEGTEVAGETKSFGRKSPARLALPSLDVTQTNQRLTTGQSKGPLTPRSKASRGNHAKNGGDLVFGRPEGSHPVVKSRVSGQPPEDSPDKRKTKQASVIHQLPPIACHTNTELSKAFRNAFRTIDSHEDAKGCFQVAASFKEMPFLKQMKLAARLTKQSVKNQNSILQKGEVR
ncbi:PREDICTED: uncharacterized protein LOC109472344 [Branchiostoma belcheri]|uniref:Uncharacterized protein LOC109472344 n=1 Tax=Branchiostoma belcheri TaxID=7741 RepID=A0A6P4Z963_BRABE|nr:PREDICTED: uncharacterized protein LOC109472344 [Branchiostoma belcheri]